MRSTLFALTFALIVGHELDAVTHAEWRLLPGLNLLAEETGRSLFVAIHLPLVVLILWLNARGGWIFHTVFGAFCAVHVGLHWAFEAHPLYSFHDAFSELLIWGAGISGLALAIVAYGERARA